MGVTPSQAAAIECDSNLLLFAGPGSGKTSTSIKKAARVLQDPSRALILCTFTVEAANELGHRLEAWFKGSEQPYPKDRVLICTLDALALRHVRAHRRNVNLLSPNAQRPMLYRIAYDLGLENLEELLPFLERYQSALDRDAVTALIQQDAPEAMALIKAYMDRLQAGGMVDLAIIKRTCALNMADGVLPPFAVGRNTCTDFLVDEVQDSDELQLLMAKTMAKHGAITTLVGDDDQTIYAWRSACGYRGMKAFAQETGAQVIRLGENFRSHQEIVSAATRLIAFNNPDRVDKQQRSMKGPGGSVSLGSYAELDDQADVIALEISEILERLPDPSTLSCAVLARANRSLDAVEASLSSAGIRHHRPGSSIWDRPEIQAYFAALLLAAQPKVNHLSTIFTLLPISGDAVNAMLQQMHEHFSDFLEGSVDGMSFDSPEDKRLLSNMATSVAMWRRQLSEGWLRNVITDAADALVLWARGLSTRPADADEGEPKTIQRLRKLTEIACNALLDSKQKGSLATRIQRLQSSKAREIEPGAVRLMTMHGSKGLEFDTVFLVDCAEREQDTSLVQAPDERRVFYVAMTRARKDLRIFFSGPLPAFCKEAGLQPPEQGA